MLITFESSTKHIKIKSIKLHEKVSKLVPEHVETKVRKVKKNFRRSEHFEYHKIKLLEKCI